MKIFLSLLFLSFGLNAEKIQSIEDYLSLHKNDNEEAVASYLSKRCAATFLVVANIFNNENKPEDKKVFNQMTILSGQMIEAASYIDASVSKRDVLEVAFDVNEEVKRIFNILWDISEDSYASGVYLTPHVKDLKICQTFAKS